MSLLLLLKGTEGEYEPPGPEATAFRPSTKPPLELDVEVETPNGFFRLPADSALAKNRIRGLNFSTQRGDGFATGGAELTREIFRDYPDIGLLDTWRFVGRQGDVAYEGRLQSNPRNNDPQPTLGLQLVGWMTYTKGRKIAPLIIDRRLSGWGEPSFHQKDDYVTGNYLYSVTGSTAGQDSGTKGPGLIFTFGRKPTGVSVRGELMWFGGGEDIGAVGFDFNQITAIGEDANMLDRIVLSTGDVVSTSTTDVSPNYKAVDATAQLQSASGTGRKYAFAEVAYVGSYEGDMTNVHSFQNVRVFGNHGLTKRGTSPAEGFYISDVMQYLLSAYYPKLTWAGDSNTFPLEQATWHDNPAFGYDIFQQLNNLVLWETNVWEDRKLYFHAADLTKYDWQIRTDQPGVTVNFQGDSIENFANGVSVTYTDFSGVKRTIYPTDSAELRDESESNPYNKHGEYGWTDVEVPWQCLEAEALQFGRAYLAEYNRPKRPGSYTIQGGYIEDFAGHWHAGWDVRCSETLAILDHPSDSPRLITATSWDQEGKSLTITVDAPSMLLDAVIARRNLAAESRNLSS